MGPTFTKARQLLSKVKQLESPSKRDIDRLVADTFRQLGETVTEKQAAALSTSLVQQAAAFNARQVERSLQLKSLGIQLPELTPSATRRLAKEAAATIRGVPAELARTVEPLVRKAATEGLRGKAFEQELGKRLGLGAKKARDKAIGQVIRVNSKLTEERHKSLGITEYVWRATPDKFTRRWHRELDGQRFSYDEPPVGGGGGPDDRGHPGSSDKCRCQAIPVLP